MLSSLQSHHMTPDDCMHARRLPGGCWALGARVCGACAWAQESLCCSLLCMGAGESWPAVRASCSVSGGGRRVCWFLDWAGLLPAGRRASACAADCSAGVGKGSVHLFTHGRGGLPAINRACRTGCQQLPCLHCIPAALPCAVLKLAEAADPPTRSRQAPQTLGPCNATLAPSHG